MFSPWLFPYYTQNLPNLPANWIRQFNTPILVPWSEFYGQYAQQLLHSFAGCIQLLLDTFPACDLILGYIFYWYETNYGNVTVPRHIIVPMNNVLMQLPWNRMKPTPTNIAGFFRLLQQVSEHISNAVILIGKGEAISNNFLHFRSLSICPNAIHCWVSFSYASLGHRGFKATSTNGISRHDHVFCLPCCWCLWNCRANRVFVKMHTCSPFYRRPHRIRGIYWIMLVSKAHSNGMCRQRNHRQFYAWIRSIRPSTMPFSSQCNDFSPKFSSCFICNQILISVYCKLPHAFASSTPSMGNHWLCCNRNGFCMWRASCECCDYAVRNINS